MADPQEPACCCLSRGARQVDLGDGGPALTEHLFDCEWLDWHRSTGGCQGDVTGGPA